MNSQRSFMLCFFFVCCLFGLFFFRETFAGTNCLLCVRSQLPLYLPLSSLHIESICISFWKPFLVSELAHMSTVQGYVLGPFITEMTRAVSPLSVYPYFCCTENSFQFITWEPSSSANSVASCCLKTKYQLFRMSFKPSPNTDRGQTTNQRNN